MTFHPRSASPAQFRSVETILSRIGDKWTVLVVVALGEGPMRFNDLQRTIPTLSGKMLITTLRRLRGDGFVDQVAARTGATRAYALTSLGHDVLPSLQALADWAARAETVRLDATGAAATCPAE